VREQMTFRLAAGVGEVIEAALMAPAASTGRAATTAAEAA
jgi:hypothetical protein